MRRMLEKKLKKMKKSVDIYGRPIYNISCVTTEDV